MMCWMGPASWRGDRASQWNCQRDFRLSLSFNSYTAVDLTPQQLMFEPWALHTARQNQAKNLPTFQKTCFPARHGPIQWGHLLPLYQKSYCPDKSGLVTCFVISAWFVSYSLQLCERARWQEAKERDPSLHRFPLPRSSRAGKTWQKKQNWEIHLEFAIRSSKFLHSTFWYGWLTNFCVSLCWEAAV